METTGPAGWWQMMARSQTDYSAFLLGRLRSDFSYYYNVATPFALKNKKRK